MNLTSISANKEYPATQIQNLGTVMSLNYIFSVKNFFAATTKNLHRSQSRHLSWHDRVVRTRPRDQERSPLARNCRYIYLRIFEAARKTSEKAARARGTEELRAEKHFPLIKRKKLWSRQVADTRVYVHVESADKRARRPGKPRFYRIVPLKILCPARARLRGKRGKMYRGGRRTREKDWADTAHWCVETSSWKY